MIQCQKKNWSNIEWTIDDPVVKQKKIETFAPEAIGIEMEAAYLFSAVAGMKTDVIIVKAVCDFGDGKKNKENQPTAAVLAADLVHTFLNDPNIPDVLKKKGMLYSFYNIIHLHAAAIQYTDVLYLAFVPRCVCMPECVTVQMQTRIRVQLDCIILYSSRTCIV